MNFRNAIFSVAITLSGLLFISCLIHTAYNELEDSSSFTDIIQPADLQSDFLLLRDALDKYHPDLHLYTSKTVMDSLAIDIQKDLDEEMTSIEFFRKLRLLVSKIKNGHTSIKVQGSFMDWFNNEALILPFAMYPRHDSMFVLVDASNEYTIQEGATIIRINDRSVDDLYEDGRRFFPSDGYNLTGPDWNTARNISLFYSLAYGNPDIYDINYIDLDGVQRNAKIKAIAKTKSFENLKDGRPYYKSERGDLNLNIEEDIAILTIPSFFPDSERRFANQLKKMFAKIRNLNIDQLIIDVRGNGGGYFESAEEVLKYLITEEVQPYKYEYALVDNIKEPHHFVKGDLKHFHRQRLVESNSKFYSRADRMVIRPYRNGYQGKIVILLDQLSASATADFLGMTKSYTDAVHIGVESSGNPVAQVAVELPTLVLPNTGIRVQLPLFRSELNTTFPNMGRGLIPDVIVEPSVHSILIGEDVQLDKAKAHLINVL